MKCKQIKDLILTEYLDGQMNDEGRRELESHISSCTECNNFLTLAREAVVDPFNKAENMEISQEEVWKNLQDSIEMDKKERFLFNPYSDFFEKLRSGMFFPKPALAFGTLALVLIMLVSIRQLSLFDQQAKQNNNDEIEYYVSLSSSWDDTDAGFNTDIEEYLL